MKKKFKLEELEITTLKNYIEEYSTMWTIIENLSSRLERVESERQSLLDDMQKLDSDIKKIKEKELQFTNILINKYGEFEIDFETFECTNT